MTKKKTTKKDKPKVEPIKLQRVTERVKHNFSDDELITFGYSLGQKYRAIRTVQSEAKATAADYKAREKSLEADIDEVSGKINAGFEMRAKDCFKMYDYAGGVVYWFLCADLDPEDGFSAKNFPDADTLLEFLLTDEAFTPVKQRPIRDDERQAKLFDEQSAGDVVDAEFDDGKQTVETS